MARCFAFSSWPARVVFVVDMVISGFLPRRLISRRGVDRAATGTDGRKRRIFRLVQHLYSLWPGPFPRPTLLGMGSSYHQFCPVAKAMELLDERWTLLIVRELVTGSERFNELRRGVPRMSPTLLSKRLSQLVRAGVVDRRGDGNDVRYVLTPASFSRWWRRWGSGASAGSARSGTRTWTPSCCCGTCTGTSTTPPSRRAGPWCSSGSPTCRPVPATGGW